MNKQQEPRLRFQGFTEAWEEKKIGEILSEVRRSIYLEDSEKYQLVTVKRRNEGVVSRGYLFGKDILVKNYSQLKTDDYLISKRQIIHGANGIVPSELDNAIVSNEYLVVVSNNDVSTEFLTLVSRTPSMYRKFLLSSYGVDIEKMVFNVEDWKSREITLPSLPEQTAIGNFFRRLDSQIAESRAVLEKSRKLKKAMLAKMFPANGEKIPKIRFKGFEGEWEEKNFESVGEFNPKTEIPSIFQYVDLESVVGTQLISYREESKETAPSRAQRLAKNGDLFFQAVRPYQKNNYLFEKNNENFVFSTGYIQIRPQNDGYFLLTLVQKEEFVQEVLLRCTGTSYPAINASSLQDIAILTPQTSKEQIAIGNFFRQLDETIALQSAEVEKLNQLKKGLLAAMLV